MRRRSTRRRRGSTGRSRAEQIERQVRAFNPVPGAWFEANGERIKLLAAGSIGIPAFAGMTGWCWTMRFSSSAARVRFVLCSVQRAGRGPMTHGELLRGFRHPQGHDAAVTRWRLTVEYDGGPFMGWQRQDHGPSVQQTLEEALQRMTGEQAQLHRGGADRRRRACAGDERRMSTSCTH